MSLRPSTEIIESLRVVLHRLEEEFAFPEDQPAMAELKRILLLRIADLEAVELALDSADTDKPMPDKYEASEQAQPLPIPSVIEESQIQAAVDKESLEKLD
jgi:hypothetical protein